MSIVMILLLAASLSHLITRWLVKASRRWGVLDVPNWRSFHTRPMPRLGGVGICTSFALTLLPLWLMFSGEFEALSLRVALVGYVVVAGVGLADDLRAVSPLTKFIGQLGASVITVWGGVLWLGLTLPYGVRLSFGLFSIVLTVLWLTGVTSIFNFMDGIDGLAGGVGVIYSSALACVCFGTGHRLVGVVSLILAVACLGFLAHNFSPAKIFMGDVGSLFVGYALAATAVVVTNSGAEPAPFMAVVLIFGTFLYDGTLTILRRLLRGERVYEAHRSHLYQRLVLAGQSHRRVSLTYYGLSALLAAGGVGYTFAPDWLRLMILTWSAVVLLYFTGYVNRVEARKQGGEVPTQYSGPRNQDNKSGHVKVGSGPLCVNDIPQPSKPN